MNLVKEEGHLYWIFTVVLIKEAKSECSEFENQGINICRSSFAVHRSCHTRVHSGHCTRPPSRRINENDLQKAVKNSLR